MITISMQFNYYYNDVPGVGKCRNNLIYTSLISEDQKTFVQWYHNDTEYHHGHNEVVDPKKMDEKWNRELCYLTLMNLHYPDLVPKHTVNVLERKIYLQIDGPDFWQRSDCNIENYAKVLPDWDEQMINIIKAHRSLGFYKYSMHPSSYFVVDGKLKSINYFFTYTEDEPNISISDVESHIHENRRVEMRKYLETLGITWDQPQSWESFNKLCWESFRTNYPSDFIERVLCIK